MPPTFRANVMWPVMIGILLTVAMWVAIILENAHDRAIDLRNAEISASNLATVFEKHVTETLSNVDQSILHFREDFEIYGRADKRFQQHILHRVLPGAIQHIAIIDGKGRLAYSSIAGAHPARQDFSDRSYFQYQRNARDDTLYISEPIHDRISGKWVIACVRKLQVKGQFADVVVFAMDAMHFVNIHADLDIGQEGAINLAGMDGIIRARISHGGTRTGFFGQRIPSERPFLNPDNPAKGIYVVPSAIDGVERIGAWRRLSKAPLVVLVLLSKAEALTAYHAREKSSYWIGGVLSIVLLGGAGMIGVLLTKNATAAQALEKMATTDALTGVANRRQFYSRMAREFERAQRYARPLSVIMIDIDFFKRVNDSYGHAAGDEVLRAISARCAGVIRESDLLGRVGGEEFCVMLPETAEDAACIVAEDLRDIIARTAIPTAQGDPVQVTASFGVATRQQAHASFESLLSRADSALYAAKQAGRNRVHGSSSPAMG